jgi:hypothetical protein
MYSHSSRFKSKTFNKLFILVGFACLFMAISTTVSADRKPKQSYQVANIVDFHSGVVVGGAATLTRSKKSVWANIHTSGLYPNSAYSIWWVVWNDPENCFDGCGEDDLEIKGNSIFHAGGFVTGDDGTANVSVHADTGSLPQGVEELIAGGIKKNNGFGAEIHLVIRSHGAILPGWVDAQIGSFEGACDIQVCDDHQAVVFKP